MCPFVLYSAKYYLDNGHNALSRTMILFFFPAVLGLEWSSRFLSSALLGRTWRSQLLEFQDTMLLVLSSNTHSSLEYRYLLAIGMSMPWQIN